MACGEVKIFLSSRDIENTYPMCVIHQVVLISTFFLYKENSLNCAMDYYGKAVLAPMVRVSELPIRALSLKYGADFVWGPEIIDKKIAKTSRVWNERLQCVDFVSPDNRLAFRTCPSLEKDKLVFQLGSADPQLAVEAASVVARDVAAVDLNCGCPKHFSVHSGMGSALLRTPDKLEAILIALVQKVGKPHGIPISVKIRILDTAAQTFELVRRLVKTGIACLTVHCRTTPMRPREPAMYDYLANIATICHSAGVACYVNGDVQGRGEFSRFQDEFGVDGIMIARAAESNPSCFRAGALVPAHIIARQFWELCQRYEFTVQHAKYCLTRIISGKDPLYQRIIRCRSPEELDVVLSADSTTAVDSVSNYCINKRGEEEIEEKSSGAVMPSSSGELPTANSADKLEELDTSGPSIKRPRIVA